MVGCNNQAIPTQSADSTWRRVTEVAPISDHVDTGVRANYTRSNMIECSFVFSMA
jgi:hypothetical protein